MCSAATSFNESTESIEQEQEQEPDSPTETDLSVVNDVQAETEDGTVDDDDASLAPKPVLDRCADTFTSFTLILIHTCTYIQIYMAPKIVRTNLRCKIVHVCMLYRVLWMTWIGNF